MVFQDALWCSDTSRTEEMQICVGMMGSKQAIPGDGAQAPVTWGCKPGVLFNNEVETMEAELGPTSIYLAPTWVGLKLLGTHFAFISAQRTREPFWGIFVTDFQAWLLVFCDFFQAWLTPYKIEGFQPFFKEKESVFFALTVK